MRWVTARITDEFDSVASTTVSSGQPVTVQTVQPRYGNEGKERRSCRVLGALIQPHWNEAVLVTVFGTILIHRIQIGPGENISATFDFQVAKTAPSNFGPLANYSSKSSRFSSKSGHFSISWVSFSSLNYRQIVKSKLSNIYSVLHKLA